MMDVVLLGEWLSFARSLPNDSRLAWFDGICNYALDGTEPGTSDTWGSLGVAMTRRMIDERSRKSRAGKSGGHASGQSRRNKIKADGEARREADGEAENEHERKKEGKNEGMKARAPTFDMVKSHVSAHFCPPPPDDFIADFVKRMNEGGWKDRNGRNLAVRGLWQRELSVWWTREKEKKSAARVTAQAATDALPRMADGTAIDFNDVPEPAMI